MCVVKVQYRLGNIKLLCVEKTFMIWIIELNPPVCSIFLNCIFKKVILLEYSCKLVLDIDAVHFCPTG